MGDPDPWAAQINSVGAFIRRQRNLANLSLRDLAELTSVSNAYLSQIERGLHEPSVRVLRSVANALNLSAETLLAQAAPPDAAPGAAPGGAANHSGQGIEAAIMADTQLSDAQRQALLTVYRSFLDQPPASGPAGKKPARPKATKQKGKGRARRPAGEEST